ncbi:MAG: aminomethyl-transferring glycine dehydrogenase [Cryomorphaceae bacterium]|jgi:glycine dehydrogenase|nr:aminomethyl-transferring glycine dehydrogenase [Cryomorphaceae bacterium]MBT4237148.1 aminomethyl-transferring glycine dehydrogenase [Cryomorphaceae bacterium]MBT4813203.1 aminomethyl-transferring glycine dehydrogenase [Cryomorphaceae bacterium]MBT6224752.1 aminomethyl-transferring glycine dehydrogenase [Cryomorphaceae bacterium]MBT6729978.1 aminomethyl-transferring glycine dehydrogenase [Cryomorphaceae bacterium]
MFKEKFTQRHIGPNAIELDIILKTIGVESVEELLNQTIPDNIRLKKDLNIPEGISEMEFLKEIKKLSSLNKNFKTYIGLGYHDTFTPSVIQRNILENPGWYTAYTPYQPEIAQGRLEALLNFQTMICDLTKMELANASLLDEGTAAAEAMIMMFNNRSKQQKSSNEKKFFVDSNILPQTLSVLKTRSNPLDIEIISGDIKSISQNDFFGCIIQYPGKDGELINVDKILSNIKNDDLKIILAVDLMSIVINEPPSPDKVDVVVGTTQRFGIPLGYGGPHAAFFATKEKYKRNIPGRIIGVTKDIDGNHSLRMALQTREQHIKRDRATSNICTAQVLLAVMAGMYAVYHGPVGLREISNSIHLKAVYLYEKISKLGIEIKYSKFFDTITIICDSKKLNKIALSRNVNFCNLINNQISISVNEKTNHDDLDQIISIIEEYSGQKSANIKFPDIPMIDNVRESEILSHPVFNSYHSETSLMRYIKSLENKDLSLTQSMISLGSCTMKLNAASEMIPLSWSEWNSIHPFVPVDQAKGYHEVISKLETFLSEITGFSATSLQPNSGAQGEYSGLMVIKSYLNKIGQSHRDICLIPSSAHGTNPASAIMAGLKVVVIGTDDKGNIDIENLKIKVKEHKDNLAALMITYPSTHGVFESEIQFINDLIHKNGGQVYMDGANMNAQVGLTSPKIIGADVCHLNLHKTFSIPHGGGGPGVGPICVAEHLKDFLPSNPVITTGGKYHIDAISSAPWGSSLVCLISYGYIRMLGKSGIKESTEIAIINANYMKTKLEENFTILYSGENGRSAHEFIIDCREFKKYKIEVIDIAKRLIDYGFHAPTVSFPVPGTMMIEPTESENLSELDRFCEALNSIYSEITSENESDREMLRNSPHTLKMLTASNWEYNYSREDASFPKSYLRDNKFWPSVRRVDEAYGDRNLICSCPPIESYE